MRCLTDQRVVDGRLRGRDGVFGWGGSAAGWVIASVLFFSLASDCGAAVLEREPEGGPPKCAIEIEFRLHRGGFDGATLERVLRFAETAPRIKHLHDLRQRYEDGPILCLVIDMADEALAIFEQLTNIVPVPRARLSRLPPPPPVVLRYKGA